jgi:uncharacterized protein YcbX
MTARIASLHCYPLKSGAGLSVAAAEVGPRGLRDDRRWILADANGRFVTGRQVPRLVLLRASPQPDGLRLEFPGAAPLEVHRPAATAERIDVSVWSDCVSAPVATVASAWLRAQLERDLRLVYMDEAAQRPLRADHSQPGDVVSFADAFPLLLISEASLAGLNARMAQPVPMARFRPNLVVAETAAHAEDDWRRIRIGVLEFDVVKACTRCVFTTVDPATGNFDPGGEPLATLKQYRRTAAGVTFGQNLIPRSFGQISVGDRVEVLV